MSVKCPLKINIVDGRFMDAWLDGREDSEEMHRQLKSKAP